MHKVAAALLVVACLAVTTSAQTKTRQCRGEYTRQNRFFFIAYIETMKSADLITHRVNPIVTSCVGFVNKRSAPLPFRKARAIYTC